MPEVTTPATKVGDVFVYTWGYDQTNADFFEVTKATGKSVVLRELADDTTETGFMCGVVVPATPRRYKGGPMTKRIKTYGDGPVVRFDHGIGKLWDGRPVRASWYA